MEKFSQFRDKGSGVAPFIPIRTPSTVLSTIPRILVFSLRLIPFLAYSAVYFLFLHNLPLPAAVRKLLLWGLLAIPGIWWVDLQIDGVKRGRLSQQPVSRMPQPGSVITASFASPIDALYLAAVFDPIFTISYPQSRKVRRVSLLRAIIQALSPAQLACLPEPAGSDGRLTDLRTIVSSNPGRVVVVFPECGTTNGKGVLPLSPSLVTVPASVRIFPFSMRYTPADITTPIPGACISFLWKLLSRPTHCIRVRIAEALTGPTSGEASDGPGEGDLTAEEQLLLDHVAEALARLGRSARVGLTIRDKAEFIDRWKKPKGR